MNVKVSKKKGVYSVFAAELVDIIAADSYLEQQYGIGECTDEESAEYALDEFNNMLRDIIGWYKYEIKRVPALLRTPEAFVIQFDQAAYNSCYFTHEDTETYNVEETAKPQKADKQIALSFKVEIQSHATIFKNKMVVIRQQLFGKATLPLKDACKIITDHGGQPKVNINENTDYVLILGNAKLSSADIKKITKVKDAGKDIQIISEVDFLEMIK